MSEIIQVLASVCSFGLGGFIGGMFVMYLAIAIFDFREVRRVRAEEERWRERLRAIRLPRITITTMRQGKVEYLPWKEAMRDE